MFSSRRRSCYLFVCSYQAAHRPPVPRAHRRPGSPSQAKPPSLKTVMVNLSTENYNPAGIDGRFTLNWHVAAIDGQFHFITRPPTKSLPGPVSGVAESGIVRINTLAFSMLFRRNRHYFINGTPRFADNLLEMWVEIQVVVVSRSRKC